MLTWARARVPSREVEGLRISMGLSSCPFGIGGVLLAQMPSILFTLVHNHMDGPVQECCYVVLQAGLQLLDYGLLVEW